VLIGRSNRACKNFNNILLLAPGEHLQTLNPRVPLPSSPPLLSSPLSYSSLPPSTSQFLFAREEVEGEMKDLGGSGVEESPPALIF